MSLWKRLFGGSKEPAAQEPQGTASGALVEDLVGRLQKKPSAKPYCYTVLFGDRPLTGKMGGDDSIMIFSSAEKAKGFVSGYQSYYQTKKPLSVLAVGATDDLWALLNNPAKDPLYKTPLGLIINFSYAGTAYNSYSIKQIQSFGKEGVKKGLAQVL